jgi:hypothetical protein
MARPSNKIAPAAKPATKANDRENRKPTVVVPKSDSVQAAQKQSAGIKASQAANEKIWKDSLPYLDPKYYKGVGSHFYTPPPYIAPKDKGPKKETPTTWTPPPPVPPEVVPVPPVKGGLGQSRNIRENYLKTIKTLTSQLLQSADSLLFAYNFKSIERMISYTLELDDQNQRQSQIVSNIKRSFSEVPLTELQIRDRLNAVINQISQEIGDLTPATTKLAKFGIKKDNESFKGGTPRIQNSRAVYDMELKLPSLEGFNYSVTYRIKCFDID